MLKEHAVKLTAETIDVKVLQIVLRELMQCRRQVAESALHGVGEPHVGECLFLHGDWVVVELVHEENSGHSVSAEHDAVGFLRIGTAGFHVNVSAQLDIINRLRALCRQHRLPPLIHLRNLGEETMSAHIHAVAFVFNGFGNAAEASALL